VTYQGYDINRYTFYTEQQDKKSMYQNSGVRVDAYDGTGQDKNMYYIWSNIRDLGASLSRFQDSSFPLHWVNAIRGVVQDKYWFISIDFNRQGVKIWWLYLKNDELSESRMPSMRKSLINLMRFLLSSPQ
jgi:hypothetical protein